MPADNKRKFQTGQPVSTRRRAKKVKLAAAQAERNAVTPSKKAQRKAARPPKPVREKKAESDDDDEELEEEEEEDEEEEGDQEQDDEDGEESAPQSSSSYLAQDSEDEDESDDEPIGKGKKGYKKKVKKPSGKKGKVFADTVGLFFLCSWFCFDRKLIFDLRRLTLFFFFKCPLSSAHTHRTRCSASLIR